MEIFVNVEKTIENRSITQRIKMFQQPNFDFANCSFDVINEDVKIGIPCERMKDVIDRIQSTDLADNHIEYYSCAEGTKLVIDLYKFNSDDEKDYIEIDEIGKPTHITLCNVSFQVEERKQIAALAHKKIYGEE